jgi:hypothetical protein
VLEDLSANAAEAALTEADSILSPADELDSVIEGPSVHGKEDELANLDNVSKATDSDVEAARKTNKKSKKKKNKKKGGNETQVVN